MSFLKLRIKIENLHFLYNVGSYLFCSKWKEIVLLLIQKKQKIEQ